MMRMACEESMKKKCYESNVDELKEARERPGGMEDQEV